MDDLQQRTDTLFRYTCRGCGDITRHIIARICAECRGAPSGTNSSDEEFYVEDVWDGDTDYEHQWDDALHWV